MAMGATLGYKADNQFSLVAPPKLLGVFKPKEFALSYGAYPHLRWPYNP